MVQSHVKVVELPVPSPQVISRLAKIEGQLRGIQNMVKADRDCVEILTQLSAVKSALESVSGQVLRNYTEICLSKDEVKDKGAELAHAVSIWVGGKAKAP